MSAFSGKRLQAHGAFDWTQPARPKTRRWDRKKDREEGVNQTDQNFWNTTFIQSTFIKILIRETFSKDSIVLQLSIKLMIWNLKFKF